MWKYLCNIQTRVIVRRKLCYAYLSYLTSVILTFEYGDNNIFPDIFRHLISILLHSLPYPTDACPSTIITKFEAKILFILQLRNKLFKSFSLAPMFMLFCVGGNLSTFVTTWPSHMLMLGIEPGWQQWEPRPQPPCQFHFIHILLNINNLLLPWRQIQSARDFFVELDLSVDCVQWKRSSLEKRHHGYLTSLSPVEDGNK